jgi:transposase
VEKPNESKLKQRLAQLPDDVESLQALVRELSGELTGVSLFNEKLKLQIARLKRMTFGSSSEKDKALLAQLELALDDLETSERQSEAPPVPVAPIHGPLPEPKTKPARRPLPEHLPRESVEHAPDLAHNADGACGCPSCGNQMR